MTSENAGWPIPGWSVAGIQLVNPEAGASDFAPSIVCQLRVDAGRGAMPAQVAESDLVGLRALAGAVIHGARERVLEREAGYEVDVEMTSGDQRLRQLIWFFAASGHVYTAAASYLAGPSFDGARPVLESGLGALVKLIRGPD